MINHRTLNRLMGFMVMLTVFASCANVRIVTRHDSDSPVPNVVKVTSYFWGLRQPNDIQTDNTCSSICIVTAKSTFGNVFIASITLGIVVPFYIEYECCPFEPKPDVL